MSDRFGRVWYAWAIGSEAGKVRMVRGVNPTFQNTLTYLARMGFVGGQGAVDLDCDLDVWVPNALLPPPCLHRPGERFTVFCPVLVEGQLVAVLWQEGRNLHPPDPEED